MDIALGGGWHKWCYYSGQHGTNDGEMGRKMNILNEKNLIFCTLETFK